MQGNSELEAYNKDFAIVVLTCASYSDALENFYNLFDKYGAPLRSLDKYIITDSKTHDYLGFETLCIESQDWQERLRAGLNLIPKTNIIFFLEDYYLCESVLADEWFSLLDNFTRNDAKYVRITPIPSQAITGDSISALDYAVRHACNLQLAIWNRRFLLENTSTGSPWDLELKLKELDLHNDMYVANKEVIKTKNGILKGKCIRKTTAYFNSMGITLANDGRPSQSFIESTAYQTKAWLSRSITNRTMRIIIKKFLSLFKINFVTKD